LRRPGLNPARAIANIAAARFGLPARPDTGGQVRGPHTDSAVQMASSAACDAAQQVLETAAGMEKWVARGAIQLALMDGGFDSGSVTVSEMELVVDKLLGRQLETQKVADIPAVCAKIRAALGGISDAPATDTPDRVFQRMGKSRTR
jgi:hypothetical protein